MEYTREQLEALAFEEAPQLDPDFIAYEAEKAKNPDPVLDGTTEERRKAYAQSCRESFRKMTADGARDHCLSQGVDKTWITMKSTPGIDNLEFDVPVMQLDLSEYHDQEPDFVIIYIHGGGLHVGDADSEELTCRRMLKAGLGRVRVYSVGYRLIQNLRAIYCIVDAADCVRQLQTVAKMKTILVGSSSGGQLAATIAQELGYTQSITGVKYIHGVMLRGPVTTDAHSTLDAIPDRFRPFHTSNNDTFLNSMSFYLKRGLPRDGLRQMPLEAEEEFFKTHPRTWIQISTNDTLYSDGLCYAMALQEVGTEIRLDVIHGWPHTFWLVAPELQRSLKAEEDMIKGLKWLLS